MRASRLTLAAAAVAIVAVPSVAVAADGHPDRTSAAKAAIQGGKGSATARATARSPSPGTTRSGRPAGWPWT